MRIQAWKIQEFKGVWTQFVNGRPIDVGFAKY